jgi:hypothetical protein
MPVTVTFDPTSNSRQAAVIQNATPFNDGVMSKEQAAMLAAGPSEMKQFLSIQNPLINASSSGAAQGTFVVPAGWAQFTAAAISAVIASSPGALVASSLVLLDSITFGILAPDANGVYTPTPGESLLCLFSYFELSGNPVAAGCYQVTITFTKV